MWVPLVFLLVHMFPIISYQPNQTFAIKLFFLGGFQFLMLLVKGFSLSCKILRTRMERRINTEAIHARGIFPGAQVVRGHDWEWKLFWNSDKYNMLVWEQCQLAVHISWEVGEKALINWVMMERWVIILLKRQFSGKTISKITGSSGQGSLDQGSRICVDFAYISIWAITVAFAYNVQKLVQLTVSAGSLSLS